MKVSSFVFFG